jgi:hypothetical protein
MQNIIFQKIHGSCIIEGLRPLRNKGHPNEEMKRCETEGQKEAGRENVRFQ